MLMKPLREIRNEYKKINNIKDVSKFPNFTRKFVKYALDKYYMEDEEVEDEN